MSRSAWAVRTQRYSHIADMALREAVNKTVKIIRAGEGRAARTKPSKSSYGKSRSRAGRGGAGSR